MYVQETSARVRNGNKSLLCHLYKTWTKIQNMMPNKSTGSAENILYLVFLSMVELFGGHPPTPADHVVPVHYIGRSTFEYINTEHVWVHTPIANRDRLS